MCPFMFISIAKIYVLREKVCLSKYKASFVGTKIEQTGKYYT